MGYQRILLPLDGSLLSEYVLPQAERMAHAFHSELTLLHVVATEEPERTECTPSQKHSRFNLIRYLQGVQNNLVERGVDARWTLRCGDPTEEIVWYVKLHRVDLVIMSAHGPGEVCQPDVASVAGEVLSRIKIPILLVSVPEPIAKL